MCRALNMSVDRLVRVTRVICTAVTTATFGHYHEKSLINTRILEFTTSDLCMYG